MANRLTLRREGAVGFIDWLGLLVHYNVAAIRIDNMPGTIAPLLQIINHHRVARTSGSINYNLVRLATLFQARHADNRAE